MRFFIIRIDFNYFLTLTKDFMTLRKAFLTLKKRFFYFNSKTYF
jgi:hypothetical protein